MYDKPTRVFLNNVLAYLFQNNVYTSQDITSLRRLHQQQLSNHEYYMNKAKEARDKADAINSAIADLIQNQ